MLCTFTKKTKDNTDKHLVVPSGDVKQIEDVDEPGHCVVVWLIGNDPQSRVCVGTALENTERIQREELEAISRVNQFQQMQQQRLAENLPVVPVGRGKAGKR